jgi:glycosyltransferase involved in cell wall biosynthesis
MARRPASANDRSARGDANAPRVAVLVPCFNEEASIGKVVADFKKALPAATIHVYDNDSTDRTAEIARKSGATVTHEPRRGKGHVVRRMFADVEADIYVLVDGDATYHAPSAPELVRRLIDERLDMVVATRIARDDAYRLGHRSGNRAFTWFVARTFGQSFSDIFSGYRAFSRRFVKSFPALSTGFEVETELAIHALELGMPVAEVRTPYYARIEGSASKLNTWRDGLRILWTIVRLFRNERPLVFFGAIGSALAFASVVFAVPVIRTYVATGLVPRLPTAVLAASLMVLAFLSIASGLVLDTVTRGRREMKRLAYLAQRAPTLPERRADR